MPVTGPGQGGGVSGALLTVDRVLERTGHSKSAFYGAIRAGRYPQPVKRGRQSLWIESEIQAAIDKEIATLPRMGQSTGARTKVVRRKAA